MEASEGLQVERRAANRVKEKEFVEQNLFDIIMGQGEYADAITEKYRVVSTK